MTEVTATRQERFQDAVKENNEEYLQEFDAGRQLAFNGLTLDDDMDVPQGVRDGFESAKESMDALPESATRNKIYVQPHPLGGLEFVVFGVDGTKASARIEVAESAIFSLTLQMMLVTILQNHYQQMAAQAQQATESGIVIPGR